MTPAVSFHIIVGTAGHIDHGKSTLVRALTGTDPDRLQEEKDRGITIDLGFAHWQHEEGTVAFVDVPGHERFVRNMLAGVGGIDAVLLVVAADEGVMPQTREHFEICRLLDVSAGAVVITKTDLVDDETVGLVRLEIAELVRGSRLERAPVLAVSARTGAGLDALRATLVDLGQQAGRREAEGTAARLPIDRVFTMRGFGTVVTGTLVAGRASVDTELEAVPGGRPVKVRGIHVHGTARAEAVAGERAALNLAGVDVGDLARGQVLASPGTLGATRVLDARLELLPDARPLAHGARVRFHQGTTEVMARVAMVAPPPAPGIDLEIQPGTAGFVRLRLERPAALTRGDRFVIRSYSPLATIGGGRVLDPAAPRGGVRLEATIEQLTRLAAPYRVGAPPEAETDALAVFVIEARERGLTAGALVTRGGVPPDAAGRRADDLVAAGRAERIGADLLVAPEWRPRLRQRILEALERHHRAQPLSEGLPREELRERVLRGAHPALADAVLAGLERAGTIGGRDRVALAGRSPEMSPDEQRAAEALVRACLEGNLAPPDPGQVALAAGVPVQTCERVAGLLVRQKVLARLEGLLFHRDALASLKQEVAAMKQPGAPPPQVDVGTFKARYGLSRKYAIPLLEYLDRERVTRRVGNSRVVL